MLENKKTFNRRAGSLSHFAGLIATAVLLSACNLGNEPEAKKISAPRLWTEAEVDQVVTWDRVSIPSPLPESIRDQAPEACNFVSFNRYRVAGGPSNASDADSAFMMMPGVLAGTTSFHHVARHMIYMAKQQHNLNYEVWAMDRRSNCLEDLHGADYAYNLNSSNPNDAALAVTDYYLGGKKVGGRTFAGYYESKDVPFMSEFGLAMATEEMFTVAKHLMPNLADRQAKLFVGGHSLGGVHTSVFLAWDQDGDPETLDDAGYNNVAGAFCFDSIISDLSDVPAQLSAMMPFLGGLGVNIAENVTPQAYAASVKGIEANIIPRIISIPNLFTPLELSFPVLLSSAAQNAGDVEVTIMNQVDITPSLKNMMRVLHSKDLVDFIAKPDLIDFRYTFNSLIGLFFDDDFSPIGFLGTSLGHLNGGAVENKMEILHAATQLPIIGNLIGATTSSDQLYIATVPQELTLAQKLTMGRFAPEHGPLYTWANFDEVADGITDNEYTNLDGSMVYTTATDEMADMDNFMDSLYDPKTSANFTEWYFPMRIVVDAALAIPFEHAVESGLNVLHANRILDVPKIEFIGGDGILAGPMELGIVPLSDNVVMLPGQNHVDPMYEVANAPTRHTPVVIPTLMSFAMEHAK